MRSDTAAECGYSLEGPVKDVHRFFDGRGCALPCFFQPSSIPNCRKNDLASWFSEIGRYSVLRADVNSAVQVRQEVVLPSLPFTFHPARPLTHTHTTILCSLTAVRVGCNYIRMMPSSGIVAQ